MKPTLPDAPGFLTCMRVFGDLIEQFFLLTQSKLECPFSFFSSDAHFHTYRHYYIFTTMRNFAKELRPRER